MLERAANICGDTLIEVGDLPELLARTNFAAPPVITALDRNEMKLIMDTLQETQGNIKQTAEKLGVARNTIYRKMKRYNIAGSFGAQ